MLNKILNPSGQLLYFLFFCDPPILSLLLDVLYTWFMSDYNLSRKKIKANIEIMKDQYKNSLICHNSFYFFSDCTLSYTKRFRWACQFEIKMNF